MNFQPKLQSFGRGASILTARRGEFLTDEQIMSATPAVFALEPHHSRSARYQYHPTSELIALMRSNGFFPTQVAQAGSKYEDRLGFTRHQVRFRQETALCVVGDTLQEIIISGAHDGTAASVINSGFMKLACLNGAMVSDQSRPSSQMKVTHSVKGGWDQLIEGVFTVLSDGKEQAEQIKHWAGLQLKPEEQSIFARAALQLRFDGQPPEVPLHEVNHARRDVDVGNDLWKTFNRVQENMTRGGLAFMRPPSETPRADGRPQNRHATTRPVRSIDGNTALQKGLWLLADEMARLKANG